MASRYRNNCCLSEILFWDCSLGGGLTAFRYILENHIDSPGHAIDNDFYKF